VLVAPRDPKAARALELVRALQSRMVEAMQGVAADVGSPQQFAVAPWLRDDGRHGGGDRWGIGDTDVFNRATVNVSQVHYDDEPARHLASATALSTIIHPRNPHAPSIHLHVSWTAMRQGAAYWRVMADLNPSLPESTDAMRFADALRAVAPACFDEAREQGARYFWIPALGRHRGVVHFYLEAYDSGSFDAELARGVAQAAIATHAALVREAIAAHPVVSEDERARQLAYHTSYAFQVLTLDRGTTSGLLVHDQNDLGILGSLPSPIDGRLLARWAAQVDPPQDQLVRALVDDCGDGVSVVDDAMKLRFCATIRRFYAAHPEALEMQARGDVVPPTVANHRG
jgi:coproporphyrinogen III oxidase